MKHLLPLFLLIFFLTGVVLSNKVYKTPQVLSAQTSTTYDTSVSLILGVPIYKLWGYTSPFAKVEMGGVNLLESVNADKDGYFQFVNFYIGQFTYEICLTAYDRNNRLTNPVCIPLPDKNKLIDEIGPVIISPSIAIGKGSILPNETVAAEGESIPDTEITVSMFRENRNIITTIVSSLIVPWSMQQIILNPPAPPPIYTTKTDHNGSYSFNLPTTRVNGYRIFTQAKYKDSPSPKSNILAYRVLSFFEFIIEKIRLFILSVLYLLQKLPFFEVFIALEMVLLIYLIKKYLRFVKNPTHRELMIENNKIMPYSEKFK